MLICIIITIFFSTIFKEIIFIKDTKAKKDRNKKLTQFIGTYPLEILVESLKLVRNVYNYSFIDSSKKSFFFKTSTINIAG